jgi:hypothetical protein
MRRLVLTIICLMFLVFCVSGCGLIIGKLMHAKAGSAASEQTQQPTQTTSTDTAPTQTPATGSDEGSAGKTETAPAGSETAGEGEKPTTTPATTSTGGDEEKVIQGTLPQAQQSSSQRTRYVPIGAQRVLTTADLRGLSSWQLDVLRNEIYAAHGRPFARADLRSYFRKQSWYVEDAGFSEARLSIIEKRNAAFIAIYQRGHTGSSGGSSGGRSSGGGGFILPFSSSRRVNSYDLQNLSAWQLDIARNEIYARHGRPFKRADLRRYFRGQSWYSEDYGFSEARLSGLEKANAEFIRQWQGR